MAEIGTALFMLVVLPILYFFGRGVWVAYKGLEDAGLMEIAIFIFLVVDPLTWVLFVIVGIADYMAKKPPKSGTG